VHHHLVKEFLSTNFDLEEIWKCNRLPFEYELVYISWHAIRHGFLRLLWLCDIAEIIKSNRDPIEWDIVQNKSNDFCVRKQFAFTIYLINILLLPLIYENGRHPFSYPHRYVSELLFLKIQEKIQSGKDEANLRYLLTTFLIKARDLHKFIPRYIKYRFYPNNQITINE
jgi:hypothetical protein